MAGRLPHPTSCQFLIKRSHKKQHIWALRRADILLIERQHFILIRRYRAGSLNQSNSARSLTAKGSVMRLRSAILMSSFFAVCVLLAVTASAEKTIEGAVVTTV